MDLHNVGMVQRGNKLCFALETGDKMGILFQIGVQQLDRHVALELRIERFPDLCHASKSQSLLEFIFAEASWMCTHNSLSSFMSRSASHWCSYMASRRRLPTSGCYSEFAPHLPSRYWCSGRTARRRHGWPG